MHPDEIRTDPFMLRKLLAHQFPDWDDLEISQVESWGTDHDIYRLGPDLVARLPRIHWANQQAQTEMKWLPKMAPALPLAIPEVIAIGEPDDGFPFSWLICRWLPGKNAGENRPDLESAAVDLARFVLALRSIDTRCAHLREPGARGCHLSEADEPVRKAIDELGDRVDAWKVRRLWEASLQATPWQYDGDWVHGDLLPGNLLVVERLLSAVIDFGGLNVGDPACDLQPAWNLFDARTRELYLSELAVDDDGRMRGLGWVVYQTVMALLYYWQTNQGIVDQALHALGQALDDFDG